MGGGFSNRGCKTHLGVILRYLFDYWQRVKDCIIKSDIVLILCDYDGTLTPIVSRPELATLSEKMRGILRLFSDHEHYKLGIISGRALEDVKDLVRIEGIYYAGNHGFEIEGPDTRNVHPIAEKTRPKIKDICERLESELRNIKGVIVEDKGLSGSVHYRLVSKEKVPKVKKIFTEITTPYLDEGVIKLTKGKKVLEIRPKIDWDKGKAVLWILDIFRKEHGARNILTIYLGDDKTDEDAFSALQKLNGISILVSPSPIKSKAKYFVKDVDEVKRFFEKVSSLK